MSDYDADVYAWSQRQGALLRRLAAGERVDDADLDLVEHRRGDRDGGAI